MRSSSRAGRVHRIGASAAILLTLAVILAACSGGGDSSNSDKDKKPVETTERTTPTTSAGDAENTASEPVGAEAAIAAFVKSQGHVYAGPCAAAKLPRDKGKWCSTLKSSDAAAGTATYDVGPVGEKPQKTITVKRRGAAQLTPGFEVGVGEGNVGQPQQLTREQLEANTFITGNLLLDQIAGIGAGLADLPAGAPTPAPTTGAPAPGGNGGTGGTGGGTPPPTTAPSGGGSQYPPSGEIVVENPTVPVGGEVGFRGSGCVPNETLQVSFDGHPIGTIAADASGAFAGSIDIPKGTAPGAHFLNVQGTGCSFSTTITVAGNLAFTGSSNHTGTYVLVGLAAVAVGAILVVGSRRRRRGIRGNITSHSP